MISLLANVLTLSLISYDRYFGIVHSLKSRITSKKSYLYITFIWIMSAILSFPSYFYRVYIEKKWSDFVERHCDDNGWPISLVKDENGCVVEMTRPLKKLYYTLIILFLFILPFFIMTISYCKIIGTLWRNDEDVGDRRYSRKATEIIIKRRKKVDKLFKFFVSLLKII